MFRTETDGEETKDFLLVKTEGVKELLEAEKVVIYIIQDKKMK